MPHRYRWPAVALVLMLCAGVTSVASGQTPENAGSTSPPVSIVAPEPGCVATVGDVLNVLLVVRDDLEVASVAVLCDAKGIGMLQAPPYALKWETTGGEPGEHVLRAFAYLKSGEKVGAIPVMVTLIQPKEVLPTRTAPESEVLKEGTPVLLQTQEKMVSGLTPENAPVRYKVARDVTDSDALLLVEYGSFAQGRVTRSRRRGMLGKAGQLEFTVDTVAAVDGTTVPLRSSQQMAGKDNKGAVIASALLLTVFAIFVNGKDVELPAGTEVMAYVDHDTEVARPTRAPQGAPLRGEPTESVRIAAPADGQVCAPRSRLEVTLAVSPEAKFARATVYIDGRESAKIERTLKPIGVNTRDLPAGNHTIEGEVQFLSGLILRSAPVRISVGSG